MLLPDRRSKLVARFSRKLHADRSNRISCETVIQAERLLGHVFYTYKSMHKKLTITIDEEVYDGLYRVIGPGKISQFIERIVRPHVMATDLDAEYASMADEESRECDALEWSEASIRDLSDEAR